MQKVSVAPKSIDNLGIFVSVLCAIHCGLTPILLVSTTFVSVNPELLEKVEIPFLIVSAFLAIFSVITSVQSHKNFLPLILALSGLAFVLLGGMFENQETIMRVTGSLLIVASHAMNKRITKVKGNEK